MKSKKIIRYLIAAISFVIIALALNIFTKDSEADSVSVRYRTYVQSFGWQGWQSNGAFSGTKGQSKRLESIQIKIEGNNPGGDIKYRTYVQSYGWQTWKKNGTLSGTKGEGKRLEAIQIKLTDKLAERYDVYYRVYAQTYGWLGWAKNGYSAGTSGYARRLEGIQILLVSKNGKAPGSTARPYVTKANAKVAYHFANDNLLTQHYDKHGKEMGFTSKLRYEEAASDVINNPNSLHKKEKEDADQVYYLESTNEFVVLSQYGKIRTYFLPDSGKDYYDRQ